MARRPLILINDSGEDIPPYSFVRVTGAEVVAGQWHTTVDKPNAATQAGSHLVYVTGAKTIADGDKGIGFNAAHEVEVAFDPDNEPTADGTEMWGPVDGEWFAGADGNGWVVIGKDADKETARVRWTLATPDDEVHAISLPGMYQDSDGEVQIAYTFTRTGWTSTTITVDAFASAADVLAALAASANFPLNDTDNYEVQGGDFPSPIYIRFRNAMAGLAIPLPVVTADLSGVFRPIPIVERASASDWAKWTEND